jgi:PRTRC genetic system protein E
MSYSDFGLDDVKVAEDKGTKGKFFCPWCQRNDIEKGFSLCFSRFCICEDCLIKAKDLKKRWKPNDGYGCFKCSKLDKNKIHDKLYFDLAGSLSVCEECIKWGLEVLNNKIEKAKNNDMEFFKKLYEMLDGIDVSIKVKRKNDKLTISVLPDTTHVIAPITVTGTPEELDEGFIEAIRSPLTKIAGLKVDTKQFEETVEKAGEEKSTAKPAAAQSAKKQDKKSAQKKVVKKEEPAKADAETPLFPGA